MTIQWTGKLEQQVKVTWDAVDAKNNISMSDLH